jgi:hypothetical protein
VNWTIGAPVDASALRATLIVSAASAPRLVTADRAAHVGCFADRDDLLDVRGGQQRPQLVGEAM